MAIDRTVVEDNRIHLYISGIALAHPGPGGYAVMIMEPGTYGQVVTYPATVAHSTTKRCILHGLIRGLDVLGAKATNPVIHVDSTYVVERYVEDRVPEKNLDLWKQVASRVNPAFTWVLTAGDDENGMYVAEMADLYAAQSARDVGMHQPPVEVAG